MAIPHHAAMRPRTTPRWLGGAWAPWTWAAASFLAYLVAPFVTLPVTAPAGPAAVPVAWTLAAAAGVMLAARLCLGALPRVPTDAMVLTAAGAALATAVHVGLHAWATYRHGYYDPEMIGLTAAFFAVVVASAIAGFGALVAPRGAVLPPLLAAWGAVAGGVLALGGNLPGLADGLDPESVVPAAIIGVAFGYVVLVAVVATWCWLRPAEPDR